MHRFDQTTFSRWIAIFALLFLAGCVHQNYTTQSEDYAKDYADVANQLLLLNIARLANNEPAYFIQLGSFTGSYTYQATVSPLGSGSSYARTSSALPASSTLSLVAPSATAMYSQNPSFTFTPLSGDAVTKTLFAPLPTNIFQTLFAIWHADAVIRTMVASIEIVPRDSTATSNEAIILTATQGQLPPSLNTEKVWTGELAFIIQPESTRVNSDHTATFTASIVDLPIKDPKLSIYKYQWQVSSNDGKEWNDISDGPDKGSSSDPTQWSVYTGSTATTLKITYAEKLIGHRYRCEATEPPVGPLVLKNDPLDSTYPFFLAVAFELRKAQAASVIPSPFDSEAEKEFEAKAKQEAKQKSITVYDIKLADAIAAQGNDYTVENVPSDAKAQPMVSGSSDPMTTQHHAYTIYKDPDSKNIFAVTLPNIELLSDVDYPLLFGILKHGEHIRFTPRYSFESILFEIAQEEARFLNFKQKPDDRTPISIQSPPGRVPSPWTDLSIMLSELDKSPSADFHYQYNIEVDRKAEMASEQNTKLYAFYARPILRLTKYRPDPNTVVVRVPFTTDANKKMIYVVGDPQEEDPTRDDNIYVTPSTHNRTVFTLLSYLFNQASIDSSKLAAPQLIEVH